MGLYSALGVVSTSVRGCSPLSSAAGRAARGAGSKCSTTSSMMARGQACKGPQPAASHRHCQYVTEQGPQSGVRGCRPFSSSCVMANGQVCKVSQPAAMETGSAWRSELILCQHQVRAAAAFSSTTSRAARGPPGSCRAGLQMSPRSRWKSGAALPLCTSAMRVMPLGTPDADMPLLSEGLPPAGSFYEQPACQSSALNSIQFISLGGAAHVHRHKECVCVQL